MMSFCRSISIFSSVYQFYTKHTLSVQTSAHMAKISEMWKQLSEKEKSEWTAKRDTLVKTYNKQLMKFKKGLSADDLAAYESQHAPPKTKTDHNKNDLPVSNARISTEAVLGTLSNFSRFMFLELFYGNF